MYDHVNKLSVKYNNLFASQHFCHLHYFAQDKVATSVAAMAVRATKLCQVVAEGMVGICAQQHYIPMGERKLSAEIYRVAFNLQCVYLHV